MDLVHEQAVYCFVAAISVVGFFICAITVSVGVLGLRGTRFCVSTSNSLFLAFKHYYSVFFRTQHYLFLVIVHNYYLCSPPESI